MKLEFKVPRGDSCLDCPCQENFSVLEIEITNVGDVDKKYIREIIAECHMYRKKIRGSSLLKMNKCYDCHHGKYLKIWL